MTTDPGERLLDPNNKVGHIKTYPTLTYVNLYDPDPDTIHVRDIAHHLSLINRYGGGSAMGINVADHSVRVAMEANANPTTRHLALECLMHDAAEAYLGDWIRPMKAMPEIRQAYVKLETGINDAIWRAIPHLLNQAHPEVELVVAETDDKVLVREMEHLRYLTYSQARERQQFIPTPEQSEATFLNCFCMFSAKRLGFSYTRDDVFTKETWW